MTKDVSLTPTATQDVRKPEESSVIFAANFLGRIIQGPLESDSQDPQSINDFVATCRQAMSRFNEYDNTTKNSLRELQQLVNALEADDEPQLRIISEIFKTSAKPSPFPCSNPIAVPSRVSHSSSGSFSDFVLIRSPTPKAGNFFPPTQNCSLAVWPNWYSLGIQW